MRRARRHERVFSVLVFGLLALTAELVGAALTHRIDLGRHVRSPSYSHAAYYPALVAAVKVGTALLLAWVLWRLVEGRATARTARRLLGVVTDDAPRIRLALSFRLWLAFFAAPAIAYLVQADAARVAPGRWALFFPWLHTSALPVFAVLSVLMALAWGIVRRWLADCERYVERAVRRTIGLFGMRRAALCFPKAALGEPPRRLFGLVFESRPPPLAA
jgi:hypothetical protein